MNFSIEQLQAFDAAAHTGSFSAAARRLGKAQSVISTAVANLEADLGVSLFDRSGRYPALTAEGKRLLLDARHIIEACANLQALSGEIAAGVEHRLTLAVDDTSHLPWLEPILGVFAERFPNVELELLFPLLDDQIAMLLSGRAQIGIGYEQTNAHKDIETRSIGMVRAPLFVAADHPLAAKKRVGRADLIKHRQIVITSRGGAPHHFDVLIASKVWRVEGDLAILELVKRGHGWAMLPEFLAEGPLGAGEISRLQPDFIPELPVMRMEVLWHRPLAQGKAGIWLRDALINRAAERN